MKRNGNCPWDSKIAAASDLVEDASGDLEKEHMVQVFCDLDKPIMINMSISLLTSSLPRCQSNNGSCHQSFS